MDFFKGNKNWNDLDISKKDTSIVVCAEIWDERMDDIDKQVQCGFGLTTLGGFTVNLNNNNKNDIVKLNYQIENNNEVGLCMPYSLIITPRKFYNNVYNNCYDAQMDNYLSDIVLANEYYIKSEEIYIIFDYHHNKNFTVTNISDLKNKLSILEFKYTKRIYFDYDR